MFKYLRVLDSPSKKAFLSLIILALCEQTIFIYPVAVVSHIGPLTSIAPYIIPIAYVLLTIMSMRNDVTKCMPPGAFLIPFIFVLAIIISIIIYPQNEKYIVKNINQIWLIVPYFLIGLCFRADKLTMETLGIWCCVGVLLTSFYRLFFASAETFEENTYNMDASYSALASILITINYAFDSKKIFPIACSLVGVFFTLSMGTRGPILIELVFIFICVFLYLNISKGVKIGLALVAVALAIMMLNSTIYLGLLTWLADVLGDLGFSTRIIDLALEEQMIEYTSGRSEIYTDLWPRLLERPLTGYGVYGEWALGYASAHNMYLETLYHYGIPLGGLILLIYIITVIRGYINASNIYEIGWLTIWSCYVFVRGVFGGSFLRFSVFLLWGFSIALVYRRHHHLKTSFL